MIRKNIKLENKVISYLESGRGDVSLIFIHGNSLSGNTFENQLNSPLLNGYRLFAIDLPGCGKSENALSIETDYSIPAFANIVSNFIHELMLQKVILVGHSLGGHVVIESLEKSSKIIGAFFFGTPPLNKPPTLEKFFLPHPAGALVFSENLNDEQIDLILSGYFKNKSSITNFVFEDFRRADGKFRGGLIGSVMRGEYEDETKILQNTEVPIAILQPNEDAFINPDYLSSLKIPKLWKGKIQNIPDSGHSPQMENALRFNEILAEFCSGLQ